VDTNTCIFFATDIHASTRCFKKFVNAAKYYKADVLVLGGDVTGKAMIPIVYWGSGRTIAYDSGQEVQLDTEAEITALESKAADAGSYTHRCSPEEFELLRGDKKCRTALFSTLMRERMRAWVDLADDRLSGTGIRVFFNAGNDDGFEIDEIIDSSRVLQRPEGRCLEIDAFCTMISTGFTNLTPFRCPRDVSEVELERKIADMAAEVPDASRCIFNLHCPPYQSQLDNAPKLQDDLQPRMTAFGIDYAPAGSTAVRKAIEVHQPLLGLHGHFHESKGVAHIGRTLCINPGSEYHEGVLRGALVQLTRGVIKNYTLTCG